jgi:hypothetical protein
MFERDAVNPSGKVEKYGDSGCSRKALTHSRIRFVSNMQSNLPLEQGSVKGALRWK